MNKYGSLYNLLCDLDTNQKCLDSLTFITEKGIEEEFQKQVLEILFNIYYIKNLM